MIKDFLQLAILCANCLKPLEEKLWMNLDMVIIDLVVDFVLIVTDLSFFENE